MFRLFAGLTAVALILVARPTPALALNQGVECEIERNDAVLLLEIFPDGGEWELEGEGFFYSGEFDGITRKHGKFTFDDKSGINYEIKGFEGTVKGAELKGFVSADGKNIDIQLKDPTRGHVIRFVSGSGNFECTVVNEHM
jgi:hypothetical protein